MRYADGGGLTTQGRARREQVRMQAAEMFEQGMRPVRVAEQLRVSVKSACAWHRDWKAGGTAALTSKGAPGQSCRLDAAQLEQLETELEAGPAARGWDDQRWTLERVAALITELFGQDYTPRGVSLLLHRMGWSPQVPEHRAAERDEEAIETWRRRVWPRVKRPRRPGTGGSASKTRPAGS